MRKGSRKAAECAVWEKVYTFLPCAFCGEMVVEGYQHRTTAHVAHEQCMNEAYVREQVRARQAQPAPDPNFIASLGAAEE